MSSSVHQGVLALTHRAWQGDDRVGQLLAATAWRKVVNGNTSTKMSTRYILDYTGDPIILDLTVRTEYGSRVFNT